MKTDEIILLLAADTAPVSASAVGQRFAIALSIGLPAAIVLMVITHGIRADLLQAAGELMFWMKLVFAGSLALGGLIASQRLGRPGMPLGGVWAALVAPVLALWLLAAMVLMNAAPTQRSYLVLGDTWNTCAFSIALLSLTQFVTTLWALKGLAPTRLALAGAGAGLLSGALSALLYALHCPESAAPFIGIWYVLGIAIPTLAGALLGPRLLRW
jgi:hypothetical protein